MSDEESDQENMIVHRPIWRSRSKYPHALNINYVSLSNYIP